MAERYTAIRGAQIRAEVAGNGLKKDASDNFEVELDGGTLTVGASGVKVTADGITATELDETDSYDFTGGGVQVATPSADNDAANKAYVDSVAAGLDWKESVKLASYADSNWTTSVTIAFASPTLTISNLAAGTSRGLIDSVEPVDNDRILIKDAGTASGGGAASDIYNGLWKVTGGTTTSLTLERTTDADEDAEVTANLAVFVEEGTVNSDEGYVVTTNDPITVNTTAITFTQFTGLGSITAGTLLAKSGNTIDFDMNEASITTTDSGDHMLFGDTSGSTVTGYKRQRKDQFVASIAGSGLGELAIGTMNLDLNDLVDTAIDVSADTIAFYDTSSGDTVKTKKESVADLIAAIAGTGLGAASGVLSLDLSELTAVAVDVAADEVAIIDATDGTTKKEAIADIITATAGDGLSAASGVLAVDINELTPAAIDVANDSFAIVDANDSNTSRKESIADFITAIAGDGLAASSGVLAMDMNELTAAAIAVDEDEIPFIDATDGSTKKESIADLATGMAGVGLTAASGAFALDLDELSAVAVDVSADSVAIIDATDGTSKKETIADIMTAAAGNGLAAASGVLSIDLNELTDTAIDVATDSFAFVDATDSGSKRDTIADFVAAIAGTGLSATAGVLSVTTSGLGVADFVYNETPSGTINGVNTTFTLANTPQAGTVTVYLEGIRQAPGSGKDYTISGTTITFVIAPPTGAVLLADYIK